jgi:arylsulfatase A-like enzyme
MRRNIEAQPFIIRWPGKVPAGRVSNEIVHIVDMYPPIKAGTPDPYVPPQ